MSESFTITLGGELPLSLTMPRTAGGLFPHARIFDAADVEVAGSPFPLAEVGATRRYTGPSFTPTAAGTFTALFVAFLDAGRTTEALRFSRDQDSYVVRPPPPPPPSGGGGTPVNCVEPPAECFELTEAHFRAMAVAIGTVHASVPVKLAGALGVIAEA